MPTTAPRSSSARALRARDAGLRRISVITRTFVVGAVAATGLFSSLAAWAQPGRSKTTTGTQPLVGGSFGDGSGSSAGTTPTTAPATTTPLEAPAGDDGGLSQPASVPTTAPAADPAPTYQYVPPAPQYSPPVVVSGQS